MKVGEGQAYLIYAFYAHLSMKRRKSEGREDKHRAVKSQGGGNTSISDLCTLINETILVYAASIG